MQPLTNENPTPMPVISYTNFSMFERNVEEWYLNYVIKIGRLPQTAPMAAGSAFDAFVKSAIYKDVMGSSNPEFELPTLFCSQVETHNRDEAIKVGSYLFTCYKECGAYASLLGELATSSADPVMELRITRDVTFGGVTIPMMGIPDLRYKTATDFFVIRDWKVNGYYSKSGVSPAKNYVLCDGKAHKNVTVSMRHGMMISDLPFEKSWTEQLCMYAWISGVPVGLDFIAGVEQAACRRIKDAPLEVPPTVRFARFQTIVSAEVQLNLWDRITEYRRQMIEGDYLSDEKKEQLQKIHSDDNVSFMFRNNNMF